MRVDGSTSPVLFSYTATETIKLITLRMTLIDSGTLTAGKFGNRTPLSNGVLIEIIKNSVSQTVAIFKDNGDISTHFENLNFGSPAVLNILGVVTPQGFLNTNSVVVGDINFDTANQDSSINTILNVDDLIQVSIRDDLSSLVFIRMTATFGVV